VGLIGEIGVILENLVYWEILVLENLMHFFHWKYGEESTYILYRVLF
jgi:hypothetical protein